MKKMHHHFSGVARKYRGLRTTDIEPLLFIKEQLGKLRKLEAADVGCGTGRYDLKFFRYLGERLYLHCIDSNEEMLKQLNEYLGQHKIKNFTTVKAIASDLPLKDDSIDCVFTFNAIHHFQPLGFLSETSRILKDKGYLFIYTRLRSQNSRNIWGRFFPLFSQKETRLYELDGLRSILQSIPKLKIESIESFKYKRVSSLDNLVDKAKNHHYSTFYLYAKEELEQSLIEFKQNLRKRFKDPKNIIWHNENILFVVSKQAV